MFDLFYPHKCVGKQGKSKSEYWQELTIYTFNCKLNFQYIVNVEKYDCNVYIVKFYLKNHRHSKDKYRLLTGNRDAPRIIRTCINIMIDIYKINPYASFGFIGANSLNEAEANSKRFRVYRRAMENLFTPLKFSHHVYIEQSAYIMLNRNNKGEPELLEKIEKMFNDFFTL
jgi:hypothetical protein